MVSIITINYNGWRDTCELIASLKKFETHPYELIVVDNASSHDDVVQIKQMYPETILICSDRNLGFAGGNNLGYQYAKGDYIFFLNNDMVVKGAILEPLINCISMEKVGAASPCVCYLYNCEQMQYYGYKQLGKITLRHKTESFDLSRRHDFEVSHETEVLYGGAMMVRREVIEKVGKMSEIYFLFAEEFDWSNRIRTEGFKIWYEASSVVYHKGGASIGYGTPLRAYYMSRARLLFVRRNNDVVSKILACMYLVGVSLTKNMLRALFNGDISIAKALFRGTIYGLIDKKI